MQRRTLIAIAALAAAVGAPALAQSDIKIAHIYSKTGPLEAYGKQTQAGLMMGLNYATGGTMAVNGRKITVIEKDDQGKPDLGKSLLAAAYSDDKVDLAVGPTSSGVALAMLPVAEEYKKILLVEPAVADSITGDKWNKYIFRTGRNSSQDAISNAVAVDKEGVTIATLAQDNAFGRDGVKAFKDSVKKAKLAHEEYLPAATTDFTAGAQRLIDKLKDQPGRKIIWVVWAGAGNPFKIADMDLKRYGIEISTGGNILPAMAAYKNFPGMEGATYYYFGIPKNPVNEALVAAHYKEFKTPPDFFTESLKAFTPSRPKALSWASVAMVTPSLSTATALEMASWLLLRPVRKMYLFHLSPVIKSATAGSTSRIFLYSSATGSMARATPDAVGPTAMSALSSE